MCGAQPVYSQRVCSGGNGAVSRSDAAGGWWCVGALRCLRLNPHTQAARLPQPSLTAMAAGARFLLGRRSKGVADSEATPVKITEPFDQATAHGDYGQKGSPGDPAHVPPNVPLNVLRVGACLARRPAVTGRRQRAIAGGKHGWSRPRHRLRKAIAVKAGWGENTVRVRWVCGLKCPTRHLSFLSFSIITTN